VSFLKFPSRTPGRGSEDVLSELGSLAMRQARKETEHTDYSRVIDVSEFVFLNRTTTDWPFKNMTRASNASLNLLSLQRRKTLREVSNMLHCIACNAESCVASVIF
jgi:hypothetical protein